MNKARKPEEFLWSKVILLEFARILYGARGQSGFRLETFRLKTLPNPFSSRRGKEKKNFKLTKIFF
jgi:hypothetical protein